MGEKKKKAWQGLGQGRPPPSDGSHGGSSKVFLLLLAFSFCLLLSPQQLSWWLKTLWIRGKWKGGVEWGSTIS